MKCINNHPFRIHASQCHKIMGRIGLTDKQLIRMRELQTRDKELTDNMVRELAQLTTAHNNPELPETCTSYLKEWYAGEVREIRSKYIDKGNQCEPENIDFAARVLGYGVAKKNEVTKWDDYMVGTCDIDMPDAIIDVKSPYDRQTFLDCIDHIEPAHEWQGIVYMRLYDRPRFIVFSGLVNTPETDWAEEVSYDHLPESERWIAYSVLRSPDREQQIIDRVILCRAWLDKYHERVVSRVGRIN